eukprot:3756299-Heterocapsa_arctica.AAC.1
MAGATHCRRQPHAMVEPAHTGGPDTHAGRRKLERSRSSPPAPEDHGRDAAARRGCIEETHSTDASAPASERPMAEATMATTPAESH